MVLAFLYLLGHSALKSSRIPFSDPCLTMPGKIPMVEQADLLRANRGQPEHRMDGGVTAWLQVFGSWILFLNSWFVERPLFSACNQSQGQSHKTFRGLPNFFGAFETYYTTVLLPTSRPSSIAWIGSTQLFLSMLIGLFAGRLLDTGYARLVFVVGSFLEVFGMLMTSVCHQHWQLLLSQGICVGIGSGLLGQTSLVVIPLYFKSRRMIAIGIAATGASLGTRIRISSLTG